VKAVEWIAWAEGLGPALADQAVVMTSMALSCRRAMAR